MSDQHFGLTSSHHQTTHQKERTNDADIKTLRTQSNRWFSG